MRASLQAVILAAGVDAPWDVAWLWPLLDRPVIQHLAEQTANLRPARIDLVAAQQSPQFRRLLGDGSALGSSLRIHPIAENSSPYRYLRSLRFESDWVLLVDLEGAFALDPAVLEERAPSDGPVAFVRFTDDTPIWTGIALLRPSDLARLTDESRQKFGRRVLELCAAEGDLSENAVVWPIRTPAELLEANRQALTSSPRYLHVHGREIGPNLWVGRGARIARDVEMEPPVLVASEAYVGNKSRLGPGAFVGKSAIVGEGVEVANAIVMPGTAVGPYLALRDSVAAPGSLANVRSGVSAPLPPGFLISEAPRLPGAGLARLTLEWLLALITMLLLPLLVMTRLLAGGPAPDSWLVVARQLVSVLGGRLRLISSRRDGFPSLPSAIRASAILPWPQPTEVEIAILESLHYHRWKPSRSLRLMAAHLFPGRMAEEVR